MIQDILVPFIAISIAEIGDKTQLAIISLGSKSKNHLQLFLGLMLAFVIVDGIAVILGNVLKNIIPVIYVKILAGIIFITLGVFMLLHLKKEERNKTELVNPFLAGFFLVFITEWGDKSQIATGLFAAQFNPFFVFIGIIIALALFSLVSIFIGKLVAGLISKKRTIDIIAALIFIILGIGQFFNL
ncbi:TMEM165/GDT1 family protein [Candidatus Woesearchaeota archaeon]|nr:TMEM165/GDT1 family protein [Candidatus Woesearchaeota archaeon]